MIRTIRFIPRSLALLAFAALLALSAGRSASAGVFEPTVHYLSNGMRVIAISDMRAPVVLHMVWYGVGSADEPPGKSGISHFLEHLMFKGTETTEPGEFSRTVSKLGGDDNAFTSYDYTGYFQRVAASRLGLVMAMEADRMVNLTLDPDHFLSERQVILEERLSRVDSNPRSILREQAVNAMYMAHPYRIPVIGWEHEIAALTPEDAIDFYKKWYAPNNATLVVAGGIAAEEVIRLAEIHYGPLEARDLPKRDWVKEPPHSAPRMVLLEDPRVGQPSWSRSYLAPSYVYGATEHAYALQLLTEILGGGTTSRLYRSLVVDSKVAVSAGSWYGADGLGPSSFGVYGSPADGKTVEDVAAAIDAELAGLIEKGVTPDELLSAKRRLQASAIFARDSVTAPARILGSAVMSGRSIEEVEAWPENISAVTAEQVREAAEAILIMRQSVTSILRPKPAS